MADHTEVKILSEHNEVKIIFDWALQNVINRTNDFLKENAGQGWKVVGYSTGKGDANYVTLAR